MVCCALFTYYNDNNNNNNKLLRIPTYLLVTKALNEKLCIRTKQICHVEVNGFRME